MKNSEQSKRIFRVVAPGFFGLALLLAGCNLAPKYNRPAVQTPPGFKETNNWQFAQPSDNAIKGKWWEMYNDTNLNVLEEQVALSNQNIAAAVENFYAARALVNEARAAYYPTASVSPGVTKSHSVLTSSGNATSTNSIGGASSRNTTVYSLPVDASWEPDLWGEVRNNVRANAYAAQATAAQLENLKLSAQSQLAVAYFQLRGQDELIRLFNETVGAYRTNVELTKTLFQTGIDSELDEAQAEALLETTIAQSTALGIPRAQYEHAIALLIGRPASIFSVAPVNVTNHPPAIPIGMPSTLLERRPDVAVSERTVAQANAEIGITRAAWFPNLSLTGSAGYEGTSITHLIEPDTFFWAVGASLTETVFDAGRRKAANDQAWAAYRATVANYRQTVLTAFQQVEDYLAALRILNIQLKQQSVAVKASERSLRLSMDRYRLGVDSYLNVITAQETLLANQQTAVSVHTQEMVSSAQLITSLGGGWTNAALPSPTKLVLTNAPPAR